MTVEQSIFSEIHESKTFRSAFAFDSYLTLSLYVNGVAVSEVHVTDTHTHKLSTVTLAAHARRGLISNSILHMLLVAGVMAHLATVLNLMEPERDLLRGSSPGKW